jgi:chromate transporter
MLAGVFGAVVTVWVTFVPCFFWIFLGAPYVEALRGNKSLNSAMSGITAAVLGVVWSACGLPPRSLIDPGPSRSGPTWSRPGHDQRPDAADRTICVLALFRLKLE